MYVNVTVNVFFSFETFSCMQILSLIAIQKGFVKLFWLSASHLLRNHVENSQVDLFLDLETFFLSCPWKLTAIWRSWLPRIQNHN